MSVVVTCEQAHHLRESREAKKEPHAKGAACTRGEERKESLQRSCVRSLAIIGKLGRRLRGKRVKEGSFPPYGLYGDPPTKRGTVRPALVTTTFVKPRLNCGLNFVIKSSHKRP